MGGYFLTDVLDLRTVITTTLSIHIKDLRFGKTKISAHTSDSQAFGWCSVADKCFGKSDNPLMMKEIIRLAIG